MIHVMVATPDDGGLGVILDMDYETKTFIVKDLAIDGEETNDSVSHIFPDALRELASRMMRSTKWELDCCEGPFDLY